LKNGPSNDRNNEIALAATTTKSSACGIAASDFNERSPAIRAMLASTKKFTAEPTETRIIVESQSTHIGIAARLTYSLFARKVDSEDMITSLSRR
jgi:hypothetical protein